MRSFILFLLLLLFSKNNVLAQEDPNIYPSSYAIYGVINNKIQAVNSSFEYVTGDLFFYVNPTAFGNFLQVNTNFAIVDNSTVLFSHEGPTFLKGSDFITGSTSSIMKPFRFDIPEPVLAKIRDNHPNAKLLLRYKYMIMGGATFPSITAGHEYFIDDTKYGFEFSGPITPMPEISGPNSVCSDEIYTVLNTNNVSLENAAGIATLTSLGSNKWKVTRVGNVNSEITLKALNTANQIVTKKIGLGLGKLPIIEGPSEAIYNQSIYVSVPITNYQTINWTNSGLPTGSVVTNQGNGILKITLPAKNSSHPNSGFFSVHCTFTGCGTATLTKLINYNNGATDPGGGDVGPEG